MHSRRQLRSLEVIGDDSIDFVFSHDALTFAEMPDLTGAPQQSPSDQKKFVVP